MLDIMQFRFLVADSAADFVVQPRYNAHEADCNLRQEEVVKTHSPYKEPLSKGAHNERVKIMATFFNNVAVSSLVVGGIAPILNHDVKVVYSIAVSGFLAVLFLSLARYWIGMFYRGDEESRSEVI